MKSRLLVLLLWITSTIAANTKISQVEVKEESQERELTDRTLTVVSKTVKISGKSFKCAISISHGCVTTLTTNIKCSGKPKSLGSIRFTKDGYTFQVDFQTPSKVIKTQLLGVPCPKCSCKSKLCSPPCPTKPSKPETIQTTTEAKKPTMTENTFSTTTIGETTKKHSTDTTTESKKPVTTTTDKTTTAENILSTTTKEQTTQTTSTDTTTKEQTTTKTSTDTTTKEQTTKKSSTDTTTTERVNETTATEAITTTDDQETSGSPTPSFHHRGQPGGFDEGCTCVPNFILFFSQHFLMQKDYQGNGFLEACYCIEEEVYTMQTIL